ncbi:hypothetical protein [Flavimaricola marinus]|uniref:Transmembrane protein (PGPGW) n=1 Tax=Flavimaricola marinus TaxID=1819565 RepID=A0A238L9B3_9RHOB|nr:hypothetical protein [Flavimaricola marinus]SMY06004.1 hypothetical protein LOM8899_00125 [Flavimaricola marinus]
MTSQAKPSRFDRQFTVLERQFPAFRGALRSIRTGRGRFVRLPLAILLIFGGMLAILPVLNLWMLPVGLLLLAIDLPFLQGPIGALIVCMRRRASKVSRRLRR